MNNVETENHVDTSTLFWVTAGISGVIVGVGAFFFKVLLTFIRLHAGPQNGLLSVDLILGIIGLIWLIKACGGGFACWYYKKRSGLSVVMGRAAMMGFLTGVAITIVSIILSALWHWIDPGIIHHKFQSDVAIIKSLDITTAQKKEFIDGITKSMKSFHNPGKLLFSGLFIFGIPNLITGMIGAKILGRKDNEGTQKQD
jgi:hypothetical protein